MRKILFVDHHAELGGGEVALLEIMRNLDKEKFSSFVLLGDEGPFSERLKKEGIEIIINKLPPYFRKLERAPEAKINIFSYIKSAVNLPKVIKQTEIIIDKYNVDIVYINSIKSLLYAAKAAKSLKRKVIWHLHDCLTDDFYPSWVIPIIVKQSRLTDNIICVSDTVKNAYIKVKGIEERTKVIYNGVDIDRFRPQIEAKDARRELGIVNKKVISAIGRLEPWKGQNIFIKAAKIICDKQQNIVFIIIGAPLFGFEKYQQDLKDMVRNSGLEKKVLFLGFRDDAEKIIGISDIIVHSSVKPEPFGRDIIEAMACGKPAISTKIGAVSEIIEDGKDGLLIEPNNPDILAEKIVKLLDDAEKCKILSIAARKKAEDIFDIKKITKKIEELLYV